MKRWQARRGNGRFTGNTMENTFGLHCEVCPSCRALNPWKVGESAPGRCHACGADMTRISCGCCRGPVDDRCCCWNHQDTPRGIPPKVCTRHRAAAAKAQDLAREERLREEGVIGGRYEDEPYAAKLAE